MLLNSLSLSWKRAKLGPSAGPVNDAVLPSGRLLKATCHISLSIRGGSAGRRCTSVPHVSTGNDRCHVATSAIVSTHLPQIGPLTEYHTVQWQSVYNTERYCESAGTVCYICLFFFFNTGEFFKLSLNFGSSFFIARVSLMRRALGACCTGR